MAGILTAGVLQIPGPYCILIFAVLIIGLICLFRKNNYINVTITNYILAALLFFTGIYLTNTKKATNNNQVKEISGIYYGIVLEKPLEKKNSFQTILQIHNPETGIRENVITYLKKEVENRQLCPGNRILLAGKPTPITNRGNPFEFDYRAYMQSQGIRYSMYLTKNDYKLLPDNKWTIQILAERSRNLMLEQFKKHGISGEEYTVVSALTLGYRKEITPDVRDYFASTGAMHVLSVSGLHVGIIYMILAFLLAPLKRRKYGRIIYTFVVAGIVWGYSVISGLSPSVQRSAVMFTFVLVGDSINRNSNILNSLAASAFFLMALQPSIIYDIGFQLSYLAVAGIVIFQPVFFETIQIQNKLVNKLWALLTVSLAAQLVTFPLGLFYFSQFPNYFWLSNFIVIPLSTIIMGGAFLLLIISPIPFIAGICGYLTNQTTHLMLESLKWIDSLPFALTDNISINKWQAMLLLLMIGGIYVFIQLKSAAMFKWILMMFIGYQGIGLYQHTTLFNQRKMVVYNSESTIIQLINGRNNYILTDATPDHLQEVDFLTENINCKLRLNQPEIIYLDNNSQVLKPDLAVQKDVLLFAGKRIQLINRKTKPHLFSDFLIFNTSMPKSAMEIPLQSVIIQRKKDFTYSDQNQKIHKIWDNGAYLTEF